MKANCASLTLYHFADGHHREVCIWHDQDHKPEVVGSVPGIFISQRWVAPAEMKALWPDSSLAAGGGEYVNLYWTTTTPDELGRDFQALGGRLETLGRMQPMRYIQRTWGGRLRPRAAMVRAGVALSPEAVTCAPQNTGLMLVIERTTEAEAQESIPAVLDTGVFSAAVMLTSDDEVVTLYYTDRPDPARAYAEFRHMQRAQATSDGIRIHEGMYRPSIGHYDFYA